MIRDETERRKREMRIVASGPGETWQSFAQRINVILDQKSPLLELYYSQARLQSKQARMKFVELDLFELPSCRDARGD